MYWLQDPNQNIVDNLNSVRREAIIHFRNKKNNYQKTKIDELETSSEIKNMKDLYKGMSDFKKGYQPRTNTVNDEKSDLGTDCHSILSRWRNRFSQMLNINGVNGVWRTGIHTAKPLVPEPIAFESEMAIEKIKRRKLPGVDKIPAELFKTGGRTIRPVVHKLINSIWNKGTFPEEWKESIIVVINKKGYATDCSNYRGMSLL